METIDILRALQEVEKRADRAVDDEQVMSTYVEVGALVTALSATDNGIVYGRRGTGKTHALRYLAESERAKGNFVLYIDVDKMLGSTEGVYSDSGISTAERATRLLVDVIGLVHTALLEDAFSGTYDGLIDPLEKMLDHFGEVVVVSQATSEISSGEESASTSTSGMSASLKLDGVGIGASLGAADHHKTEASTRLTATGDVRHRVHFGAVGDLMRKVIVQHPARRCWLLFDEWSILPLELQPFLAEMLRRVFFGLPKVTVRVAAIPHRTNWRILDRARRTYVGLEIGAEIFPLLDLDEFVVFPARNRMEQARRASDFFKALLFRHVNQILASSGRRALEHPDELVRLLFTQVTALEEMVRAAEGVPRDALAIVSRAALRAGDRKVSTDHIRDAAAQIYIATKATQLNASPEARALLDLIITDVISEKKARAFLLAPEQTEDPVIQQLIDDRILHLIKRGYSSKDDPGTRFDVLQIDYGCYVHLLRTDSAPIGLFGQGDAVDNAAVGAFYSGTDVPADDYRAIRRAVLDLPAKRAMLALSSAPAFATE
jgi:hypothetical protein